MKHIISYTPIEPIPVIFPDGARGTVRQAKMCGEYCYGYFADLPGQRGRTLSREELRAFAVAIPAVPAGRGIGV